MAKGYFSQLSNCEPKLVVFNLTPIFGIKTCQKKLLYSCHNSATFKPNKWPKRWAQTSKKYWIHMQPRYNIPSAQLCFKRLYLPCFNSELQIVYGIDSWLPKLKKAFSFFFLFFLINQRKDSTFLPQLIKSLNLSRRCSNKNLIFIDIIQKFICCSPP